MKATQNQGTAARRHWRLGAAPLVHPPLCGQCLCESTFVSEQAFLIPLTPSPESSQPLFRRLTCDLPASALALVDPSAQNVVVAMAQGPTRACFLRL